MDCSKSGGKHPFLTLLLVGLFIGDVFTDVATGVELILNDHQVWGYCVLALIVLPIIVSILGEFIRSCVFGECCGENSTDWIPLICYHFYTIFMLIGADCQESKCRWHKEATYLRCLQGFFQSAPQLILQCVIFTKGVLIHSLREVVDKVQVYFATPNQDLSFLDMLASFLVEKPGRWFWGLIQVYSIVCSFMSLLQTCIQFSEWSKRRQTLHRLLLIIPFFISNILYRLMMITIICSLVGFKFAAFPIGLLFIFQIITFKNLGLDMARSIVYGFCSILAPAGYSRSREPQCQPFGLSLMPGASASSTMTVTFQGQFGAEPEVITIGQGYCGQHFTEQQGDRTPEQVDMLRERSKNFLAMHIILGGGILGITLAILGLLVNFTNVFRPLESFIGIYDIVQMNDLVFPLCGIIYLTAVLLTGIFSCCIGRCFEEEYIYPV